MFNKKITWAIIIFVVIASASLLPNLFKKNNPTTPQNHNIILYFLETCPHCVIVEEFIQTNKIEEKITITKKDVAEAANAKELIAKEKFCKLPDNEIGSVPLLWDDETSKCFLGDKDIINFLQGKIAN